MAGPSGPTDVNHTFIGGATSPFGISADGTYVYWANRTGDAIGRARLDLTPPVEPTWTTAATIDDPRGVAALDGSIYFTHVGGGSGKVGRFNRNGTGLQSSFVIGGTGPDPCGLGFFSDRIMFANQNPTDSIGRSHGMFPETQNFVTATDNPCGVASTDAVVYWANQGSNSIGRSNFDGSNAVQNWLQLPVGTTPCAVAIAGDHVYWTATGTDQIGRAQILSDGSPDPDPVEDYITGVTDSCGLTVTPRARTSPTSATFAETSIGGQSDPVALSITDRSSSALDISSVAVIGPDAGDFELADGCTGSFAITGCLINARFSPTAAGQRDAVVRVTSNADNSPTDIPLSGVGVAPASQPPPEEPPAEPPPTEPPAPKDHSRSLTIAHAAKTDRFKGVLEADDPACVEGQKVSVFRQRQGADRRVGSDDADATGRWKVGGSGDDGRYYAAVKQSELSNGDSCLAATSPKVKVG